MNASAVSTNDYAMEDFIDIRGAIRQYVEPLLKKNNFVFSHSENSTYVFHHQKKTSLLISFLVKPEDKCICCDLQRDNQNDLMAHYPLSMFASGIPGVNVKKCDGYWHYHSEEELIAILEDQVELLINFGFEWLFDHLNMEIEEC